MAHITLPLDYSDIDAEIRQRAKVELNETMETRIECLKELKEMIKGERDLDSKLSEIFLLQFLRVKKFNTDKAFTLLKRYYSHRRCYKSLYRKYTPKSILIVMDTNMMNFLPWRTPDGCAIWVSRCGLWEPEISDFEDIVKCGLMCHEKILQNPVTQICGVVTIVDLEGFSWSHLLRITPSIIKCFVTASQNCFPIRHKAIHVVKSPSVFSILFAMIKPLLKDKIKDRIYFHGEDLSSLHQFLSPNILPEEYGGTRGKFGNAKFIESLLESEEEFIHNNTFGYKN